MKRVIWTSVVVAALVLAAIYAFGLKYGELEDVELESLKARLAFPRTIRAIPLEGACSTARLSRSWIECGGVCGTEYRIAFQSTATEDDLTNTLISHIAATQPDEKSSVLADPEASAGECRNVMVRIWNDSRDAE